jgi:methylphosphotriester-DNA--protein-cysteine methyltransferase
MSKTKMIPHAELDKKALRARIGSGQIRLAGNQKLKIYGLLSCKSGKRMKRENRVFFQSETEAKRQGYRPCGHCLPSKYREWKLKAAI